MSRPTKTRRAPLQSTAARPSRSTRSAVRNSPATPRTPSVPKYRRAMARQVSDRGTVGSATTDVRLDLSDADKEKAIAVVSGPSWSPATLIVTRRSVDRSRARCFARAAAIWRRIDPATPATYSGVRGDNSLAAATDRQTRTTNSAGFGTLGLDACASRLRATASSSSAATRIRDVTEAGLSPVPRTRSRCFSVNVPRSSTLAQSIPRRAGLLRPTSRGYSAFTASRTEAPCAPCAGRPSCARPGGRRA